MKFDEITLEMDKYAILYGNQFPNTRKAALMRSKNKEWLEGIVAFVNSYKDEYGSTSSINQIADAVGCGKSTVDRYLKYLQEQDAISIQGRMRINTKKFERLVNQHRIPICGKISCGVEKLEEEDIEDYISLPSSVTGKGTFFILRAEKCHRGRFYMTPVILHLSRTPTPT